MSNVRPGLISSLISVALAVDLAVTFALMMTPVREYVELAVLGDGRADNRDSRFHFSFEMEEWIRNIIRAGLVIFTASIAVSVPDFAVLVGLAGGITDTFQTFVIPPFLFVTARAWSDKEELSPTSSLTKLPRKPTSYAITISSYFVAALGTVFMCWTVYNFVHSFF